VTPLGTCPDCSKVLRLTSRGRLRKHDIYGVVVRARLGRRRKKCSESGRLPKAARP
jgi:hypothetical protein